MNDTVASMIVLVVFAIAAVAMWYLLPPKPTPTPPGPNPPVPIIPDEEIEDEIKTGEFFDTDEFKLHTIRNGVPSPLSILQYDTDYDGGLIDRPVNSKPLHEVTINFKGNGGYLRYNTDYKAKIIEPDGTPHGTSLKFKVFYNTYWGVELQDKKTESVRLIPESNSWTDTRPVKQTDKFYLAVFCDIGCWSKSFQLLSDKIAHGSFTVSTGNDLKFKISPVKKKKEVQAFTEWRRETESLPPSGLHSN